VSKGLPRTKVYDAMLNELMVLKAMAGSPHIVQLQSFMHSEGGESPHLKNDTYVLASISLSLNLMHGPTRDLLLMQTRPSWPS
jgi:hypothetical protein